MIFHLANRKILMLKVNSEFYPSYVLQALEINSCKVPPVSRGNAF